MNYPTVAITVIGSGVAAGALAWVIRKQVRLEALRRHHEIGSAVFLQLGVIFAVLLAFVFSEVWSEYNTAASAINEECGSLHGVAILAATLPPAERDQAEHAMVAYLTAVTGSEWASMARRQSSDEARERFEVLVQSVARMTLHDSAHQATRSQMLSLLGRAHQFRETRLFQMTQAVPKVLWGLLIGFAVVLIGFLLCFGIEYVWSQLVFTGIFDAAIVFVLMIVILLDHPFEGALRQPSTDFRLTLAKVSTDFLAARRSDGHRDPL
jgi:hypothetical protein